MAAHDGPRPSSVVASYNAWLAGCLRRWNMRRHPEHYETERCAVYNEDRTKACVLDFHHGGEHAFKEVKR